jgi:uncharacterized coiled-coil protein SlyX
METEQKGTIESLNTEVSELKVENAKNTEEKNCLNIALKTQKNSNKKL